MSRFKLLLFNLILILGFTLSQKALAQSEPQKDEINYSFQPVIPTNTLSNNSSEFVQHYHLPQIETRTIEGKNPAELNQNIKTVLQSLGLLSHIQTQFVVVMPGDQKQPRVQESLPPLLKPLSKGFHNAKSVTLSLSRSLSQAVRDYSELHPWRITMANVRFVGIGGSATQIILLQYGLNLETSLIGGLAAGLMSWGLMINLDWETRFLNKKGWIQQSLEDARLAEVATKWYTLEVLYANIVAGVVLGAGYLLQPEAPIFNDFSFLKFETGVLLASAQGMLAQGTLERFVTYIRQKKQEQILSAHGLPWDTNIKSIFEDREKNPTLYKSMERVRFLTMIGVGVVSTVMTSLTLGAAIGVTEFNYILGVSGAVGLSGNVYLHWNDLKQKFKVYRQKFSYKNFCRMLFAK